MAELKRPDFMKNILLYRGRADAGPKTETENRLTKTFETENQQLTEVFEIKPFSPKKQGLTVDITKLSHTGPKTEIKNQLTKTFETKRRCKSPHGKRKQSTTTSLGPT